MKHFESGMYGGKFFPFHKGHLMCIDRAANMCDKLYVILFINGEFERKYCRGEVDISCDEYLLTYHERMEVLSSIARLYPNVKLLVIDVRSCVFPDGSENWDAETPLVLQGCGIFDAVFSSEPSYGEYFERAYPWAEHILIDPPRHIVPISATMIRNMNDEEAKEWIVDVAEP